LIDGDSGLVELATNAGRDVKKRTGMLFTVYSICGSEEQSGINRIRLMARMTPHQLKLVPTEWRWTHKAHQETGEVVEEWPR